MGRAGSGELVQGTLPLLILRTLATGPNHGFAIARRIQQVSKDVLRVEEGSLYPALHRLEVQGYLLTDTVSFENARRAVRRCGALQSLRKIASVVVHEEWHVRHPGDEFGAYAAQLSALVQMGAGPGSSVYLDVWRARRAVLRSREESDLLPDSATRVAGAKRIVDESNWRRPKSGR
jgi:hypothetical protein